MIYTVRTGYGMGLRSGTKTDILRQEGTNNIKSIEKATAQDIAWVRAMGGYVPPEADKIKLPPHQRKRQ